MGYEAIQRVTRRVKGVELLTCNSDRFFLLFHLEALLLQVDGILVDLTL